MDAMRHWHGYEWAGSPTELREDNRRRPSKIPAELPEFMSSAVPPIQTGHWLLRRRDAAASRTWTDVDDVVTWLTARYERNPPSAQLSYISLDERTATTRDGLLHGVDAWWEYYTGGMGVFVAAAICCPHAHLRALLCPMPPS